MTRPPDAVRSFKVVCQSFVSVGFPTEREALLHLNITKVHRCPHSHRVEHTDRPYGTTGEDK